MAKISISMPNSDLEAIFAIAKQEEFDEVALLINPESNQLVINAREAQIIINLMVFEGYKHTLKYPYYDTQHPRYNSKHQQLLDDFFHGLYLRITIAIEQHFPINRFGQKV